jgi:glycosyltransferase involved in cell wall biosynthesis
MVTPTGAERMTFEVLAVLRERGAAVHCVLNDWANDQIIPMAERIGATWSAAGYSVRFDRHTRDPRVILRQTWDVLRTSGHLLKQAIRFRPTHVLVPEHVTVIRNAPALVVLRLLGIPCVMRLCNAPDPMLFYRWLWRWMINPLVSHFVCNSRFTRGELLDCGISPVKVSLIANVRPSRAETQQDVTRDSRKVIFVGQVIPPKGLHVLLDAVSLLAERGVDVSLDVIGRMDGWLSPVYGDYWVRLRERVATPDLVGRVRLLGWRDDVDALLRAAAIHCCPSMPEQRESFGIVVLEAKAAGLPSVVFPSGGLSETVTHGVDGWLCPEPTAAALAEGLQYFLQDTERLARAGLEARRSTVRYGRDVFDAAWWSLLSGAAWPPADDPMASAATANEV